MRDLGRRIWIDSRGEYLSNVTMSEFLEFWRVFPSQYPLRRSLYVRRVSAMSLLVRTVILLPHPLEIYQERQRRYFIMDILLAASPNGDGVATGLLIRQKVRHQECTLRIIEYIYEYEYEQNANGATRWTMIRTRGIGQMDSIETITKTYLTNSLEVRQIHRDETRVQLYPPGSDFTNLCTIYHRNTWTTRQVDFQNLDLRIRVGET